MLDGSLPIDLRYIPFSRFGSYLSISRRNREQCRGNSGIELGLWLRNLYGEGQRDIIYLLRGAA